MNPACRAVLLAASAACVLLCAGCAAPSLLFTSVVEPYSVNFSDTPVGTRICRVADYQVRAPVSGQSVTALWSLAHIRKSLEDAGITRVCYIDRKTLSVLRGMYRRRELIIYGE